MKKLLIATGILTIVASLGFFYYIWGRNAYYYEQYKLVMAGRAKLSQYRDDYIINAKVSIDEAKMVSGFGIAVGGILVFLGWRSAEKGRA